VLFMGVPAACLLLWRAVRQAVSKIETRRCDILLWALLVTLLVLDVSGKSLGETARLWMFFMPLGVLVAAAEITEEPYSGRILMALSLVTVFQLVCFRVALNVFGVP